MDEINKLKKQIESLSLKAEGIKLEYEYVNSLKDKKIQELSAEIQKKNIDVENKKEEKRYYKKEFDEAVKKIEEYKKEFNEVVSKMEEYKKELEQIRNSRWWKLREKIKRINKKGEKI